MKINNIVIIGMGGTGSLLIEPLIRFLVSQSYDGDITLCDGDSYEEHNLDRQSFDMKACGKNKAEYQCYKMTNMFDEIEKQITYIDEYLSKNDIEELIEENTIVINCVDNRAARKYVEDTVTLLDNGAHICCGNESRDGQVNIHLRRDGISVTPSIYKDAPSFNSDNDDRSSMTCEELSLLPSGGQLICANMMAATLALGFIVQIFSTSPIHQEGRYIHNSYVQFDIYTNNFESRNPIELCI